MQVDDDLFDGYTLADAWDEMFEAPGQPRSASFGLYDTLRSLSPDEFDERCAERGPVACATVASPSPTPAKRFRSRSTRCRG